MDSFLLKDKFIGSMLGTHIGDALGMPVEGKSCEAIEKYFGEIRDMLNARLGAGTYAQSLSLSLEFLPCKNSLYEFLRGFHRASIFLWEP